MGEGDDPNYLPGGMRGPDPKHCPQALLPPGTQQIGAGPSKYRGFLMAASGENIPAPFIFAGEHYGDLIIKLSASSCYGALTSPCIHHPEESGSGWLFAATGSQTWFLPPRPVTEPIILWRWPRIAPGSVLGGIPQGAPAAFWSSWLRSHSMDEAMGISTMSL